MSATNRPRPRRLAGHRPSALPSGGRPRKVADSRRVAVRPTSDVVTPPPPPAPEAGRRAPVDPAGGRDAEGGRARPSGGRLRVVLSAVAVVLATAVGLLAWDLTRIDARADARKAAQVVAAESMETILSYDHARYDKDVADAQGLMTDGFAEKYADTVDTVRDEVMDTESAVRAEVVASSVVSADRERVRILLFVNQTTTGRQVQEPRVDLNRVVVSLVRDGDGGWLVSDVDAL